MFQLNYSLLVFLIILNVCNASRRIVSGTPVQTEKRYMIYLIKAENDPKAYDAWLCGGALVSPTFIITSAACVQDVEYMYAIAGYIKYVPNDEINNDECIKNTKKKVVYTCVPKYYELDYDRLDRWAHVDIAVAKIESPYRDDDKAFEYCSYVPKPILINYENKYQVPGTDAMVLGWGHQRIWRMPNDTKNYNAEYLHYAPTVILNKDECKKQYAGYNNMSYIIDNYMICCLEMGNLDEKGDIISPSDRNVTGCSPNSPLMRSDCLQESSSKDSGIKMSLQNTHNIRKPGICQNDHGGPLVTWVGAHEVLIGVASVFRVDSNYECIGPYLYTSTQCNGAFLNCILEEGNEDEGRRFRRDECNTPRLRGYDTIENYISWANHPDGPATNEQKIDVSEQINIRPQQLLYGSHN